MSKRKPPTTSKKPVKGKMAAKAKHAIVKSPKRSHISPAAEDDPAVEIPKAALRDVLRLAGKENKTFEESSNKTHAAAGGADASSAVRHPDGLKQEAHAAETSEPPHGHKPSDDERNGFDVLSALASTQGYQAKLLEISNANVSLAFEFAQRLARVRSPVEFIAASSEFTGKRIAMFLRHSREIGELVLRRSPFG
jgi:Phasin protein